MVISEYFTLLSKALSYLRESDLRHGSYECRLRHLSD